MTTEDETLGKYVYCTQHLRVHATGWCTVGVEDKLALQAETLDEAVQEAKAKGYVEPGGRGVLFTFKQLQEEKAKSKFLPGRPCSFCGRDDAPHRITRLTPEQREANQAWVDSFNEGFHTGHCPHLELPTYACQACYDAHPESHYE